MAWPLRRRRLKNPKFRSTILAVLLAIPVVLVIQSLQAPPPAAPQTPGLKLVENQGRPWIYWKGQEPSPVQFQMEDDARLETIGLAEEVNDVHVVELAGWLGTQSVRIHAQPERGKAPPSLEIQPQEVQAYLDRLSRVVVETQEEAAWNRLGSFSELYFSPGYGDFESKKRLHNLLVARQDQAVSDGAPSAWMWPEKYQPSQTSSFPGAPRVNAGDPVPQAAALKDPGIAFSLPAVDSQFVELEVHVEVSPTPAKDFWFVATLGSGWKVLLIPGEVGGYAYQRLDPRALSSPNTSCLLTIHGGSEAPKDLRVSLLSAGLRYLPTERNE